MITAIQNLFQFDNVSFGQVLTIGEVYRAVTAVAGVDYVVITGFTTTSGGTSTIDNSGIIAVPSNRLPKFGITGSADTIRSTVILNTSGGVSAV